MMDDKPVDDGEIGRKRRGRNVILLVAGVALGCSVGYGMGSIMSDRRVYNVTVRDGASIYKDVKKSSDALQEASKWIDQALRAARGVPGKPPTVDVAAVEALRRLAKPFAAEAFARKRYNNFKVGTVDALFEYYNKVGVLWDKFSTLASRTLPPQRRADLEAAAEVAKSLAGSQTGCVPVFNEGRLVCELVFVSVPREQAGEKSNQVTVSSTRRGVSSPKTLYAGQDLKVDPGQYVVLTDTPKSVGVLGQQASVFAEYQRDLIALRQLADSTLEVQGRLERELGEIARLREVLSL